MTFARLVLAAVTNDPLPEPQSSDLPVRQTAQSIVQYYIANIYALFPLFSESVLLTALDEMYQPDRHVSSANKWLVYVVLAIGSLAQSRSNQDEFYTNGVDFLSRGLQFADRALQPGYVTQIQSLALFTQYAMLDPAHFDSWHLIGFTCRAVVDLGFHQDPPSQGQADRELDMRRRTFYCVYALDRYAAVARLYSPKANANDTLQGDKYGTRTCLFIQRRCDPRCLSGHVWYCKNSVCLGHNHWAAIPRSCHPLIPTSAHTVVLVSDIDPVGSQSTD